MQTQRRERLYTLPDINITTIAYTQEQLEFAHEQCEKLANYYAGGDHGTTFYAQDANLIGALGQNTLNDYLVERNIRITPQSFFVDGQRGDCGDFILHTQQFGDLISDIKATKCNDKPHGGYWCKVKEQTVRPDGRVYDFTKKKIHHYVFTAVDLENWYVHVLGVIRAADFWNPNTPHTTIENTLPDGTIIKQRRVRARELKPLWDYLHYYQAT